MSLDTLITLIQEEALPGVWSKGVALAREKAVLLDREAHEGHDGHKGEEEWILRIKLPGQAVSPRVSIWPADEDAHCDCGSKVEPCMHVVAALVALKNGWAKNPVEATAATGAVARLVYRFSEVQGALCFERGVVRPSGVEEPLRSSLISFLGGISSGRISAPPIPATREDFKVDEAVSRLEAEALLQRSALDRRGILPLLTALKDVPVVEFQGNPIRVDPRPIKLQAVLEDTASGVRLRLAGAEAGNVRAFSNGAVLAEKVMRPVQSLSKAVLDANGREFREAEIPILASKLLPVLERETDLHVLSRKIPRLEKLPPRIVLESHTEATRPEELEVMARLVYGWPPIAEVIEGKLEFLSREAIPERSENEEQALLRELQLDLHLKPRQRIRLQGKEAIEFVKRSRKWENPSGSSDLSTVQAAFTVQGVLTPELRASRDGLALSFSLPASSGNVRADPSRVLEAWYSGQSEVPLLGGGWAKLPKDWLEKNADRVERFLALRNPTLIEQVQIAEIVSDAGGELSSDLELLREKLTEYRGIPEQPLPKDLRAELRPYQKVGVNWLGFLRDSGLGAILADDMGLGKTLQALCVVRGRTLIICPTSVLPAWEAQTRQFRPGLRLNVYSGSSRKLEAGAEITLTSYGILRQDRALLTAESWDSIVLDEAQHIKNPDSQIARVVHELQGKFKLALTGTPIENRLDDLWSQFQFVQPGLLGTREDFQRKGSLGQLDEIRRRIKPLILRRMKRDVAPELPPKTETVLYSVLTEQERTVYQTILAATRQTVLQELETGGSVLGALEALLRLRQVCAHPALVNGFGEAEFTPSSKLELLRETLEESLGLGHSVLVFSQWTSLLDRVERVLHSMGTDFLRLDGTTRDRGEIVRRFQDPEGPRVMILSLKAGGVGLTLTRADHVILLDPWWNPAVEEQAADRAHRIGQARNVLVQRLVARDTVEDRILQLQSRKRELAQAILGTEGQGADAQVLTREDLLELLR